MNEIHDSTTDSSAQATREFLRFKNFGDPEAMARVFDLVAPKLLLLAGHLTKDAATAEDLVQTTFLQAIEGAHGFDSSYPSVMPWLSQILRRRAQDVCRKVERESRLLSSHQPEMPLPLDPQIKMENEEATRDFEEALESLPEKYRSVLILRLVQGMEPKDIGYSLGIDPGTVRTQLKRGLAWLRQRMRYGTALSIAISMIATRGMADVRRVVVERASLERAATPWWTSVTTPRVAAALVAGAIVLAGSWILLGNGPVEAISTTDISVIDPSVTASAERVDRDPDAPRMAARTRVERFAGLVQTKPKTDLPRMLSVVWSDDGQPASNTPITLRRSDVAMNGPRLSLTLDQSGQVSISGLEPGTYDVHHYGFGKQYLVVPDDDSPLHLTVDSGATVSGQVLDDAGTPVEGSRVWTSSSLKVEGRFVGVTDEDGRFEFRHAAIDQLFVCQIPGGRWSEARIVRGTPDLAVVLPLRVCAKTTRVHGLVARADGEPIANAIVDIRTGDPMITLDTHGRVSHHPRRLMTDKSGRFELQLPADAGDLRLRVVASGYAPWHRLVTADKNGELIQSTLQLGYEVAGYIRDVDGRGVANASVSASSAGILSFEAVSDDTGYYRLLGLPVAEWKVAVDAGDRGHVTRYLRLGHGDRLLRVDHVVAVTRGVRGTITDASGRPAEGLIVVPVASHHVAIPSLSTDHKGEFFIPLGPDQFDSVLISARTDTPPIGLHAVGSDSMRITLGERHLWNPSAFVKGRIDSPVGSSLHLRIEHHDSEWSRSCAWSPVLKDFRVGPLPPGGYDLVVYSGRDIRLRIPFRLEQGDETDLGIHQIKSAR